MNNDAISAIFRDDEIIVSLDDHPYIIDIDHRHYDNIVSAVTQNDVEELRTLLQTKHRATKMFRELEGQGLKYDENDNSFTYQGNPLPMDLNDYLRTALENDSAAAVVKFIQRLFKNPNHRTRMHLFAFMDKNKHPMTLDGRFVCYKSVRSDYMDKYSGRINNAPGTTVEKLSWSNVDTNPDRTCSRGYHACSRAYLETMFYSTGDRVVTVAVAPEDVGAIPTDYDGSKLRCRGYEVLNDITDIFVENMPKRDELGGSGRYLMPNSENVSVRGLYERDIWG